MANRQPSLKAIIKKDYWSFLATLTIVVTWCVILLLSFFWPIPELLMDCCFGLTALCLIVLSVQIAFLFTTFADGKQADATICRTAFSGGRGRIEFTYAFHGKNFQSGNTVHHSKRDTSYQVGDTVTVMVDANKPKRAYIRDLFL